MKCSFKVVGQRIRNSSTCKCSMPAVQSRNTRPSSGTVLAHWMRPAGSLRSVHTRRRRPVFSRKSCFASTSILRIMPLQVRIQRLDDVAAMDVHVAGWVNSTSKAYRCRQFRRDRRSRSMCCSKVECRPRGARTEGWRAVGRPSARGARAVGSRGRTAPARCGRRRRSGRQSRARLGGPRGSARCRWTEWMRAEVGERRVVGLQRKYQRISPLRRRVTVEQRVLAQHRWSRVLIQHRFRCTLKEC